MNGTSTQTRYPSPLTASETAPLAGVRTELDTVVHNLKLAADNVSQCFIALEGPIPEAPNEVCTVRREGIYGQIDTLVAISNGLAHVTGDLAGRL